MKLKKILVTIMLFTLIASSMTTGYCYSNTVASKGNNAAAQKANSDGSSFFVGMVGLGVGTGAGYSTYKLMTYGNNKLDVLNHLFSLGREIEYYEFDGSYRDFDTIEDGFTVQHQEYRPGNKIRMKLEDLLIKHKAELGKFVNEEAPFRTYTDSNGCTYIISKNIPANMANKVFENVIGEELVTQDTGEVIRDGAGQTRTFSGIMCEYHNALFSRVMKVEGDRCGNPQNPIMVQFNFNPALQPYLPYIMLGISALVAVAVIAFICYIAR